jgi:transcriptional regulator with XRE-family HTH domain
MRCRFLPQKLGHIRAILDLTQEQLLKELGLEKQFKKTSVSSWELPSNHKRNREPPYVFVLRLARYLNICPAVLMDDDLELPEALPAKRRHKEQD